mgnify:CR=1 FL=1
MREIGLAREKVRTEIHAYICACLGILVLPLTGLGTRLSSNSTLIGAACAWLCGSVVCVFYSREQH